VFRKPFMQIICGFVWIESLQIEGEVPVIDIACHEDVFDARASIHLDMSCRKVKYLTLRITVRRIRRADRKNSWR
jgi:hypothetical protein